MTFNDLLGNICMHTQYIFTELSYKSGRNKTFFWQKQNIFLVETKHFSGRNKKFSGRNKTLIRAKIKIC